MKENLDIYRNFSSEDETTKSTSDGTFELETPKDRNRTFRS